MKRIILNITLLLFIVYNIKAQEEKDIILYKNGDILYSSILTSSDNIKFTKSESSMVFNHIQNGNVVKQINVSDIDSICFEPVEESVVINGVRWATRNVGTPGTFAANPEDFGEYYQWNRGMTDFLSDDDYINSSYASATSWLPSNDPSPVGYRVPTLEEMQSLLNTDYVTGELRKRNGVYGFKFTDKASRKSIFLPLAYTYRETVAVCGCGQYWANSLYYGGCAYTLQWYSYTAWISCSTESWRNVVRPVAK